MEGRLFDFVTGGVRFGRVAWREAWNDVEPWQGQYAFWRVWLGKFEGVENQWVEKSPTKGGGKRGFGILSGGEIGLAEGKGGVEAAGMEVGGELEQPGAVLQVVIAVGVL